jgi:S1-C subfamily serine protease
LRDRRGGGTVEGMRALLSVFVLAACGPAVTPKPTTFDEDVAMSQRAPATAAPVAPPVEARVEAPPGKGLRSGTIERARLVAVLDGGPGSFLRQLEVSPRMDGDRFVGWQLVQLIDRTGPLGDLDVVPGDVLLAINGKPVSRPDQLQLVWDSLRTANEVVADLWRGSTKLQIHFDIEPHVSPSAK